MKNAFNKDKLKYIGKLLLAFLSIELAFFYQFHGELQEVYDKIQVQSDSAYKQCISQMNPSTCEQIRASELSMAKTVAYSTKSLIDSEVRQMLILLILFTFGAHRSVIDKQSYAQHAQEKK